MFLGISYCIAALLDTHLNYFLTPLVRKTDPDAMDGRRQDGMHTLGLQIYIYHRVGCITGSFTYNFHRKGIILWA
jgi:hypothetical protein